MVRLQNGPFSSEGRVQVYCNGVWYTVCGGSSFSVNDADTVCLQLGYKGSGDITEMLEPAVCSTSMYVWKTFIISKFTIFISYNYCLPVTGLLLPLQNGFISSRVHKPGPVSIPVNNVLILVSQYNNFYALLMHTCSVVSKPH